MLLQQVFIDPGGYKNIMWLINYLIQPLNNPVAFQYSTLKFLQTYYCSTQALSPARFSPLKSATIKSILQSVVAKSGLWHFCYSRDWFIKSYTGQKNIPLIKKPQFCSDLAEILAILPIHELIILTKFDGDWTKIVDFLLFGFFYLGQYNFF